MIRNPVDVATRVSPRLSALIESRVSDPDAPQPVTLAAVRIFVAGLLSSDFKEAEQLHHFDLGDSVLDELDALIEEFGSGAPAIDFAQQTASEALSRVIEAVLDDENREFDPTLTTVREAIVAGLPSRLVGEGVFEDDEDDNLLVEVDALIDRFGPDALAEGFLRYD